MVQIVVFELAVLIWIAAMCTPENYSLTRFVAAVCSIGFIIAGYWQGHIASIL